MPEALITIAEAVAMLETIGAAKETVRRFRAQAEGATAARHSLGDERVIVTALYGAQSEQPGVNLDVGTTRIQMDVKSAQRVALNILGAVEAAISDAAVMRLLREKVGIHDPTRAGLILLDLREMRQGTRDVIFPQ